MSNSAKVTQQGTELQLQLESSGAAPSIHAPTSQATIRRGSREERGREQEEDVENEEVKKWGWGQEWQRPLP